MGDPESDKALFFMDSRLRGNDKIGGAFIGEALRAIHELFMLQKFVTYFSNPFKIFLFPAKFGFEITPSFSMRSIISAAQ